MPSIKVDEDKMNKILIIGVVGVVLSLISAFYAHFKYKDNPKAKA